MEIQILLVMVLTDLLPVVEMVAAAALTEHMIIMEAAQAAARPVFPMVPLIYQLFFWVLREEMWLPTPARAV